MSMSVSSLAVSNEKAMISGCLPVGVTVTVVKGRGRKTCEECAKHDLRLLGLEKDLVQDRSIEGGVIVGTPSNP